MVSGVVPPYTSGKSNKIAGSEFEIDSITRKELIYTWKLESEDCDSDGLTGKANIRWLSKLCDRETNRHSWWTDRRTDKRTDRRVERRKRRRSRPPLNSLIEYSATQGRILSWTLARSTPKRSTYVARVASKTKLAFRRCWTVGIRLSLRTPTSLFLSLFLHLSLYPLAAFSTVFSRRLFVGKNPRETTRNLQSSLHWLSPSLEKLLTCLDEPIGYRLSCGLLVSTWTVLARKSVPDRGLSRWVHARDIRGLSWRANTPLATTWVYLYTQSYSYRVLRVVQPVVNARSTLGLACDTVTSSYSRAKNHPARNREFVRSLLSSSSSSSSFTSIPLHSSILLSLPLALSLTNVTSRRVRKTKCAHS